MKATITIEIEGDPEDINAITRNLQSFMRKQPSKTRMMPAHSSIFPLKLNHHNNIW